MLLFFLNSVETSIDIAARKQEIKVKEVDISDTKGIFTVFAIYTGEFEEEVFKEQIRKCYTPTERKNYINKKVNW